MRLVYVTHSIESCWNHGNAHFLRGVLTELQARGHDVHVLRLAPQDGEAAYAKVAEEAGLMAPGKPKLHILPVRNVYWPYDGKPHGRLAKSAWHLIDMHNPAARADFARFLEELKPDLVNTSVIDGFSTSIFGAVREAGIPLIHTLRDYYLICTRSGMFRDGKNCETLCASCKLTATVRARNSRNVDLFISISNFVVDVHARNGAFPEGTEPFIQWNINEMAQVSAPRRLGDKVVFGFIGRIVPAKGLEKLLEAAELQTAPQGARDWEVVIAGSGDPAFDAVLRERYAANPRIRFLGWCRPEELYGIADVLVCPSTYKEPLSRVVFEGYGFALPAIAARTGGIPELIDTDSTGFLYDPEDAGALSDLMLRYRTMDDETYARMSAAALRKSDLFTPEAVLDAYEARVEVLLDQKAKRRVAMDAGMV